MSIAETQLTLRLAPQEIYRLDNFLFAKQELKQALETFVGTVSPDFIYLAGEAGMGKSHLLLACAEAIQKSGRRVIYLPLAELVLSGQTDVFEAMESVDVLCLDDLQAIAGLSDWEEAVFHCFNRFKASGGQLLVAANTIPQQLGLSLADLTSRLGTGIIYQLSGMNDELKQRALILQAQARGLTMNEDVAQFLLRHYGRDMPSLMASLIELDKVSLQEQRRLTIPFIRQVLAGG